MSEISAVRRARVNGKQIDGMKQVWKTEERKGRRR